MDEWIEGRMYEWIPSWVCGFPDGLTMGECEDGWTHFWSLGFSAGEKVPPVIK